MEQEGKEVTHTSRAATTSHCWSQEARESEELTNILHRAYDNVMVEMEELKPKGRGHVRYLTKMPTWNPLTRFKSFQGFEQEDVQKIG
ncbi:hypothetical protein Ahy_B02g058752 [Arachis hypogaea]|uniref:Uncharacterized protein n=1 Tax=Arachis hypogaea TaxID=3818 RepID=A0A445AFC4_ARAHY|nr:hypothetical protein Ahy_B02g058752 [Arachis hypogaea]